MATERPSDASSPLKGRRRLLALLPAALGGLHPALAQRKLFSRKPKTPPAPTHPLVYFGTDTTVRHDARGIYGSRFDPAAGRFEGVRLVAETLMPTYLALSRGRARTQLYCGNEGDAHNSTVSGFAVDLASGSLAPAGRVPAGGGAPCYLSVDPGGRALYTANYDGTVAVLPLNPDQTLRAPAQVIDLHGLKLPHGPNPQRQQGPHPHAAMFSPDDRFLLVVDLGSDAVILYAHDPATGGLADPHVVEIQPPGAGPRHMAFHPNGRWIYLLNELTSQVAQYLWSSTHGSPGQPPQAILTATSRVVSTLAPGFHGANTAAEIAVSPNGYYLYASNRGEDSLAVFRIDQANGALTPVQHIACGGRTPRHFTLDETGRWLLCANRDSDNVAVFARDAGSGMLSGPVSTLAVPAPVFTLLV